MSEYSPLGNDLFGRPINSHDPGTTKMLDDFGVPPFSVLDARQGYWQDRKKAWIAMGIESELGRDATSYDQDVINAITGQQYAKTGVSVFDPVLCEMAYRWFSAPGDQVIDPFAGGSVRGIIASTLGRRYWGCDLSAQQILANMGQLDLVADNQFKPEWVHGDSVTTVPERAPAAAMVLTCPPYGDLEVYSEDPRDISNMTYDSFMEGMAIIMGATVARLIVPSYIVMVVGDFRDPAGAYRGFPHDCVHMMRELDCELYNSAVIVTPVGSMPVRAAAHFPRSKKMTRGHQDVLVFANAPGRAVADRIKTQEEAQAAKVVAADKADSAPTPTPEPPLWGPPIEDGP